MIRRSSCSTRHAAMSPAYCRDEQNVRIAAVNSPSAKQHRCCATKALSVMKRRNGFRPVSATSAVMRLAKFEPAPLRLASRSSSGASTESPAIASGHHDAHAPRLPICNSPCGIGEQVEHRLRLFVGGGFGHATMLSRSSDGIDAFECSATGEATTALRHRHRLEHLVLNAAREPQRRDDDGRRRQASFEYRRRHR